MIIKQAAYFILQGSGYRERNDDNRGSYLRYKFIVYTLDSQLSTKYDNR